MTQMFNPMAFLSEVGPAATIKLSGIYTPAIAGLAGWGGAVCDGYARIGSSWFEFVKLRLDRETALRDRLAACASPSDVASAWTDFGKVAAEDYKTEFARLADIGTATQRCAAEAIRTSAQVAA